jgi:hypothetical protein
MRLETNVEAAYTPASSNVPQGTAEHSSEEINRNVIAALRANLLSVGANFDGSLISDLTFEKACESTVVTAAERTTLSWGDMGNIAARVEGEQQTVRLPAEDPEGHVLSVPQNDDGDGIVWSIGLLVSNCDSSPFVAR